MTDPWGVEDGYWDVGGEWHDVTDDTRRALRLAMGGLVDVDDPPPRGHPVWFVRHGTTAPIERPALLVLEDGTEVRADDVLPADLPLGYHDLHPSDGGITTRLIVVPDRVAPPPERAAALAVQLYAARSTASWGMGDFADLRTVVRWAAALGIGEVLVSPLHAPLPLAESEASPYFASSRCWRNPLHLRIEAIDGYDEGDPELAELAARGRALDADARIDRGAVWQLKRAALARIRASSSGSPAEVEFARWRASTGEELERYATFCALTEHHGTGWSRWPAAHRHPSGPAVGRFAVEHPDEVTFHAWIQWQADRQHHDVAAASSVGLVHDLAVGADPDGADAWLWQDVLAHGVRVGAPPDAFNDEGQDWGLPPFVPWRLRASAYAPLAELFRTAFRHGRGLRVDHVMGLFRLWWIPPGSGPREGGYVRYPGTELLDVLALESQRAGAFVVGEDLGTVEDAVRAALDERGVLSYRLAWFEDGPPETWPRHALAAMTTHDLPTVAGVWSGRDDPDGAMGPKLDALLDGAEVAALPDAAVAAHRRLARAPSYLVAATLEDAIGVADRPNVPGTTIDEHPNWSVALPVPVDELGSNGQANAVLRALTTSD